MPAQTRRVLSLISSPGYPHVKTVAPRWVYSSRTAALGISLSKILLAGLVAGAFFTGCAVTPIRLPSEWHFTDPAQVPPRPSASCLLQFSPMEDLRPTKDSLGSVGGRFVYVDDIAAWLKSGFRLLEKSGHSCEFETKEAQSPPHALRMSTALNVANVRSSSSSRAATVVLTIRYFRGDRLLGQRTYRGSSTGVNWFGSQSEITDQFAEAFSQLLKAVSHDIAAYCTDS